MYIYIYASFPILLKNKNVVNMDCFLIVNKIFIKLYPCIIACAVQILYDFNHFKALCFFTLPIIIRLKAKMQIKLLPLLCVKK